MKCFFRKVFLVLVGFDVVGVLVGGRWKEEIRCLGIFKIFYMDFWKLRWLSCGFLVWVLCFYVYSGCLFEGGGGFLVFFWVVCFFSKVL
jgi:hypothetical protein